MRDFTLKTYRQLLETFLGKEYRFTTFQDYQSNKFSILNVQSSMVQKTKVSEKRAGIRDQGSEGSVQDDKTLSAVRSPLCILRHDVDRLPGNSLATAKIEAELGIKGTYYFRIVPKSFDERIIKEIASLGHEIGYHYEEVDTAYRQLKIKNSKLKIRKSNGAIGQSNNEIMINLAYELFKVNLAKLREAAEVKTICMHGSPLSKYDNKLIWSKYNYKDLGIIGEPYLDIDWNEFGYLTDTGRRWDGESVAVRDKVSSQSTLGSRQSGSNSEWLMFKAHLKSTQDIINASEQNKLPDKIMINVHPQRWTNNKIIWLEELIWQNVKNVVKRFIVMNDE